MKNIKNYLILLAIITLLVIVTSSYEKHYGYDYIDFNNKKGIAEKCEIADTENEFRGLLCKVKGHWIEVKQYGKR